MLFALIRRAVSRNSIIYAIVSKAIIKHDKDIVRNKITYVVEHTAN